MLATTIHFDVVFWLLIASIALCLLGSTLLRRFVKVRPWFIPLAIACLSAAVLFKWSL